MLTVIVPDAVDRVSTWSLVQEGETFVASKVLTMIFRSLTELVVRLVLEVFAIFVMVSTLDIVTWQSYIVLIDLSSLLL